jgi:protein PhnA
MTQDPMCPKCGSENIYSDGSLWICPDCGHEVTSLGSTDASDDESPDGSVYDAFGNQLQDGDTVTVIKDLKVKGASGSVKVGTKVKGIRLVDGSDGHNIACRIEGFGAMNLKSEFVKKV